MESLKRYAEISNRGGRAIVYDGEKTSIIDTSTDTVDEAEGMNLTMFLDPMSTGTLTIPIEEEYPYPSLQKLLSEKREKEEALWLFITLLDPNWGEEIQAKTAGMLEEVFNKNEAVYTSIKEIMLETPLHSSAIFRKDIAMEGKVGEILRLTFEKWRPQLK